MYSSTFVGLSSIADLYFSNVTFQAVYSLRVRCLSFCSKLVLPGVFMFENDS